MADQVTSRIKSAQLPVKVIAPIDDGTEAGKEVYLAECKLVVESNGRPAYEITYDNPHSEAKLIKTFRECVPEGTLAYPDGVKGLRAKPQNYDGSLSRDQTVLVYAKRSQYDHAYPARIVKTIPKKTKTMYKIQYLAKVSSEKVGADRIVPMWIGSPTNIDGAGTAYYPTVTLDYKPDEAQADHGSVSDSDSTPRPRKRQKKSEAPNPDFEEHPPTKGDLGVQSDLTASAPQLKPLKRRSERADPPISNGGLDQAHESIRDDHTVKQLTDRKSREVKHLVRKYRRAMNSQEITFDELSFDAQTFQKLDVHATPQERNAMHFYWTDMKNRTMRIDPTNSLRVIRSDWKNAVHPNQYHPQVTAQPNPAPLLPDTGTAMSSTFHDSIAAATPTDQAGEESKNDGPEADSRNVTINEPANDERLEADNTSMETSGIEYDTAQVPVSLETTSGATDTGEIEENDGKDTTQMGAGGGKATDEEIFGSSSDAITGASTKGDGGASEASDTTLPSSSSCSTLRNPAAKDNESVEETEAEAQKE